MRYSSRPVKAQVASEAQNASRFQASGGVCRSVLHGFAGGSLNIFKVSKSRETNSIISKIFSICFRHSFEP
jgi:hypothetical protein